MSAVNYPDIALPLSADQPNDFALVLVIENDEATVEGLQHILSDRYRVVAARRGDEALTMLGSLRPRLVLLDMALQDMPGFELCRLINEREGRPVIMMAGGGAEAEVVASFLAGADAYVTKPYRWHELAARVGAALRRAPSRPGHDPRVLVAGDVSLDTDRHEVRLRGELVELPLREFQLLEVFLSNPGKLFSREVLMRKVWGETPPSGTKSVDVHVKRIRDRIEDDASAPSRIITVRGSGYVYAAPGTPARPG